MGNCCMEKSNYLIKLDFEVPNNDNPTNAESLHNNHLLLSPIKKKNCFKIITNRHMSSEQSINKLSTDGFLRHKTKAFMNTSFEKRQLGSPKNQAHRQNSSTNARLSLLKHLTDRNAKPTIKNHSSRKLVTENYTLDNDPFSLDNDNKNNENGSQGEYEEPIEKEFSLEEQKNLISILTRHSAFKNISHKGIIELIEAINEFQINENSFIFKEGDKASEFFIIKEGKVKISIDKIEKLLFENDTFGDIALLDDSCIRKYSAQTINQIILYAINKKTYLKIRKENTVEERKRELNLSKIHLFKSMDKRDRKHLESFLIYEEHNANSTIKKETTCIFLIIKGQIQLIINKQQASILNQGMYLCMNQMFTQLQYKSIEMKVKEKIECFRVTEVALLEVFGLNYQKKFIIGALYSVINNDLLLSKLYQESHILIEQLMTAFHIKEYKNNDVIFSKGVSPNYCVGLIHGALIYNQKDRKVVVKPGDFYNRAFLFNKQEVEKDIISEGSSIGLETNIDELLIAFTTYCPKYYFLNIINSLSLGSRMFSHLSIENLIKLANHIKIKKYVKNKLILAKGQSVTNVYIIIKGTVKEIRGEQVVRIIEEGNSFGEFFLLNEENIPYDIIAKSETVICFLLSFNYFIELLQEQKMNDYIRNKMCLEETTIELTDLYYLSYLGRGRFGNVCLVHNGLSFYAIKAISKSFAENQKFGVKYLLSEKKTMFSLDHPFVGKLIKTLKNDNWCFFLQEYISGKNMSEYLETKRNKKNIPETKFYSASMFVAISYIHKRKIIHRDIKPSNIMIDKNGYIKIIDFGTAKKSKDKSKTIIGTPNFLAPEVLNGKGYSYQCDYWSIGICIYFMYYGILPFGNNSIEILDTYKEILDKEVSFPDNLNIEINSLLSSLLWKDDKTRYSDLKVIKTHLFFKEFNWDDLISYKLKPTYMPEKDPRGNLENLQNTNYPFVAFMENEKFETKATVTLKYSSKNVIPRKSICIPTAWFDDF